MQRLDGSVKEEVGGAGIVTLRSAPAGTGVIAGGPMRAVFEALGIHDIVYIFIGIMIFLFTYKIFNSNRIISNFYYSWVFSLIF